MKDKPHNKKSPEGPHQSKRAKPEYPYMSGYTDTNGKHKLVYADPSKPENSFTEHFNHDGSFVIHETLKDEKGLKNELYHHSRQYGISKSSHHDGQVEEYSVNKNVNTEGEHSIASKGNIIEGSEKKKITAYKQSTKSRHGASGSGQNHFHSTSGDGSYLFEGNYFSFYEKDHGQVFGGSQYTISKEGDIGTHVQDGNYDTQVKKKLRLASNGAMSHVTSDSYSASAEKTMALSSKKTMSLSTDDSGSFKTKKGLTLQCDQTITIKVGSAKIEITPSSINVTGSQIKFN
jgi:hypothetical protein